MISASGSAAPESSPPRLAIGPFGEDAAVAMTVAEMQAANPDTYTGAGKASLPEQPSVAANL